MCAFANASGGRIGIGVADDDNTIKGITNSNDLKSKIQDLARSIQPFVSIQLHEYENVILVSVEEGDNKPYQCSDGFYMRMGANAQKMDRDEILKLSCRSGKIRFDEQICAEFHWTDFDDDKFRYYLKLAGITENLDREEVLKNFNLLTTEGGTNACVLLFAKKKLSRHIISSKLSCVHFKGNTRVDILDKKLMDKGIIGNIEFAIAYLKERVPVRYEIESIKRKEFPQFPEKAYREMVVNALIHNDYFEGDTITVEKHENSIIVNNRGELMFPQHLLCRICSSAMGYLSCCFAVYFVDISVFYSITAVAKKKETGAECSDEGGMYRSSASFWKSRKTLFPLYYTKSISKCAL